MYQRSGSSDPQKLREAAHAEHRKADAGETKGRRAEDRRQAKAEREVARQQLEQGAERKIGDNQQARGGAHEHGVAAKGNLESAVDDAERRRPSSGRRWRNSGASLPTSAASGLPPAARSHARRLRRENSEPTA